jgi:DNA-binding NtrC family response regulator
LSQDGYEVIDCETAEAALAAVHSGVSVAVICQAPERVSSALLLRQLRQIDLQVRVILRSSSGSEQLEALQEGAYYATRAPMHVEEVALLVRRALHSRESGPSRESQVDCRPQSKAVLIGEAKELLALREAITRLSAKPGLPVLIVGESGAGKSTVARVLHEQTCAEAPFAHLIASSDTQLDLHASLQSAEGGTLCLGEISDVPLAMQTRLSRICSGTASIRVRACARGW